MKKTVSLVLGSGGARGYAHIGVIEELEKMGYEIVSISGSSMGSLVGGFYACGKLDAYKKWVLGLDMLDIPSLLDFSWDRKGVVNGEKLYQKLFELIGERQIEQLPIKYTAVATDLKRNKEVWFQEGDLLSAIRASISIPSLLTPVERDGMLLVDGGVLNPLPVAPTMSDKSDITIAVNVYADTPKPMVQLPKKIKEKQSNTEVFFNEFLKKTQRLIGSGHSNGHSYHLFDIIDMTLDSMQNTLIRYRLGGYPADITIQVSKDVCGTYDFHKAYEVIEAGRMAVRETLKKS